MHGTDGAFVPRQRCVISRRRHRVRRGLENGAGVDSHGRTVWVYTAPGLKWCMHVERSPCNIVHQTLIGAYHAEQGCGMKYASTLPRSLRDAPQHRPSVHSTRFGCRVRGQILGCGQVSRLVRAPSAIRWHPCGPPSTLAWHPHSLPGTLARHPCRPPGTLARHPRRPPGVSHLVGRAGTRRRPSWAGSTRPGSCSMWSRTTSRKYM
eukprot:360870-Chlamydomonas_euryale.AAC.27